MPNYDAGGTTALNNSKRATRKYSDLDLDFGRNTVTNDVNKLTNVEAVKRSVRNLINTAHFERPFHQLDLVYQNQIDKNWNIKFAVQNILLPVQWGGFEYLLGILYMVLLVIVLVKLKNNIRYIIHLFLLNALILNLLMLFIVPKIEQHSQGSMIEFFQKHNQPNEYVTTYGFRSYAKFFYSNKQKPDNSKSLDEEWLLNGAIDKPVYIVSKMYDKEKVLQLKNVKFLYEKGGFVFYVRN
jgi:hypothetical protein